MQYWLIALCALIILISGYYSGKHMHILKDFSSTRFRINFAAISMLILVYVVYSRNSENKEEIQRLSQAIKQSLVALMIAYFSHLDMVFEVFLFVFVFTYVSH